MSQPKCVLYHRVSTLAQNVDLMESELRKAADRYGYQVLTSIKEVGSGAKANREGLAKLMDLAKQGEIQAVLVYKLDRFARSTIDLLNNVKLLRQYNVRFIAFSQGIDIGIEESPTQALFLTILSGMAQFEKDLIKDRILEGIQGARERGIQLGRPRVLVSAEEVTRLRSEGCSERSIAKQLGCSTTVLKRLKAAI